ncbi:MAG: hypothetical protein U0269_38025 [Polyangiales bacterium]
MKGDPLPNLFAVLRALTAPEDGDEHPFLREAAHLDHVYLNPLGVAARVDGVRARWQRGARRGRARWRARPELHRR